MLISMILVFAATRGFLTLFPSSNLDIGPYNVHHLFTGILLMLASGLPLILSVLKARTRWIFAAVFGAGLALVLDEWVYLIVTEGTDADYLLKSSLIGALVLIAVTSAAIIMLGRRKR